MKVCPSCKATYPDDANFCPQESCATENGPQRLQALPAEPASRFQLLNRVGGRSTGEVWKGHDGQSNATIAYKIIAAEVVPNPTAAARLERELRQLMKVSSPRIAGVLDCGRTSDERFFVVMEHVEGESLDRILRNGPLPLDRAKGIVAQVGQALLDAQKAGLVHRDVAPKNVLVTPGGEVKVINFAVARPINDKAAGVPAYLSPEQALGKPVDQRSNTYSLAAILYHMLTGEPPFHAPTPEGVLELHVSSPPLAPSQRRPEANLSPETDRVLLKALDKNSSRRHLTLRLFLTEVEALSSASRSPQAQAATGAAPGRDNVGFAKTMLFAGGQQEVANLVAKAIATRSGGGTPAGGVPQTSFPSAQPVASAQPAATPAVSGVPVGPAPTAAPAPVAPAAPVVQAPIAAAPASAPIAQPPVVQPQAPAPVVQPAVSHAAPTSATIVGHATSGVAATMFASSSNGAMNGTGGGPGPGSGGHAEIERPARLTPPPVTPYSPPAAAPVAAAPVVAPIAAAPLSEPRSAPAAPPSAAPAAAAAPQRQPDAAGGGGAQKGAAFRETLWFKKGDVEHMIAEAKAKMGANGKPVEPGAVGEDFRPIEDRYVDDGSLTVEDRKKFSLRTGATQTALPKVSAPVPGDSMSEEEVIKEVSGGTKRTGLLIAAAVVVVAALVAVFTLVTGKGSAPPPAPAPAAAAIPVPAAPPPPAAAQAPTPTSTSPIAAKPPAAEPVAAAATEAEKPAARPRESKKASRRDKKKRRAN
jgi:hypothetical protein